jgi:putative hemolysin
MADHLENGTYLLDETERQRYTVAARMLDRVDRRLDLGQPLADFDYLLLMCAHLILTGEQGVDATLARIVSECLEERRRH